ncbi:hypothetical protein AB9E33_34025, partial [Rhizobium leguminosarum]|uniref:hypothetical protein n=1 Tax=Rhizobium leguminosarum TaxID=384 RepID=UPI003F993504
LRLAPASDVFELVDWFSVDDFFLSIGVFESEGIYEFANIIDLGATYTSRFSASTGAFGEVASLDIFDRSDASPKYSGTPNQS